MKLRGLGKLFSIIFCLKREVLIFTTLQKTTVILGATPDPTRYACKAANMLVKHGHPIVPVGIKKGEVAGKPIQNIQSAIENVDTITLYIGTKNLPPLFDYIIGLNPKRIIFNPGTENDTLIQLATSKGIETVVGCTLVMLSTGNY